MGKNGGKEIGPWNPLHGARENCSITVQNSLHGTPFTKTQHSQRFAL
jgi:hypothetical protein